MAFFIKQLLRPIALQPLLQQGHVVRRFLGNGNRHLMRPESALNVFAGNFLGAGPAFGSFQHQHWPDGPPGFTSRRSLFDSLNIRHSRVQSRRHLLVHIRRLAALHKIGVPAAALKESFQLLAGNAGKNCRVGNFVTVQVQNRQHRAVGGRINQLVSLPSRGQRAGFRLAVAHHRGRN